MTLIIHSFSNMIPFLATLIDTMVRYFDWVRETSSSICVPHVDMLLSRPAHSVDRFFQENAITFKPRV